MKLYETVRRLMLLALHWHFWEPCGIFGAFLDYVQGLWGDVKVYDRQIVTLYGSLTPFFAQHILEPYDRRCLWRCTGIFDRYRAAREKKTQNVAARKKKPRLTKHS